MKSTRWLALALTLFSFCALGQVPLPPSSAREPVLVEVGPNSRSWTIREKDPTPTVASARSGAENDSKTGSQVVEIATGMNYWDGQQWTPSDPSFEITEDAFVADRLQHKVRLTADLNTIGAVTVTTRDGITLHSTPVGIGLYDAASGRSAIIAATTNSYGVLVSNNRVVYENAFSGICADVVYTIHRHSFEQDVVITGRLDPADYGFPTDTTRIQIYTEFYGTSPQPERIRRPIWVEQNQKVRNRMVSPDLVDEVLGFGEFVLTTGRAATLARMTVDPDAGGVPVAKQFTTIAGRTFLIESVQFSAIQAELLKLPECGTETASIQKGGDVKRPARIRYAVIPSPRSDAQAKVTPDKSTARIARTTVSRRPGVVIDYIATVGSTVSSGSVFQGDTTYLVSGLVSCSGTVTIEGGAVFKFKHLSPATASIQVNGTLICKTSSYRPVVFTAVDDDTVGDTLNGYANSGYTTNPHVIYADGYANPALWINTTSLQNWTNLCFRYCQEAVRVQSSTDHILSHAQLVNCIRGIKITGSGPGSGSATPITVNNALFASVPNPITVDMANSLPAFVQCTFDGGASSRLVTASVTTTCYFTNSILANFAAWSSGSVTLSGNYNGFYSTPTPLFGNSVNRWQASASPFESQGAGNYYLGPASGFQDRGMTSINAGLANDIKGRTTVKPQMLYNYWLLTPETWVPTILRDGNTPDLGYHYTVLDRLMFGTIVSNTSLSLGAGLSIGVYGYAGFFLTNSAKLCSQGTPSSPVQLCYFNQVQEQPILLSPQWPTGYMIGGHNTEWVHLQSTRSDLLASGQPNGSMHHFYSGSPPWEYREFSSRDCSFAGGLATMWGMHGQTFLLNNNLFQRTYVDMGICSRMQAFNNLFYGCPMEFLYGYIPSMQESWDIRDNTFDKCSFLPGPTGAPVHSHNAYVGMGTLRLDPPQSDDKVLTSLTYASGPFGAFYQSSSSPLIESGTGGASAADRGLSAYTVLAANNTTDSGQVDIGLHYPALNSSSQLLDVNNDGTPDYSVNSPPLVNAGADFTATSKRFRLDATVLDDGRGCSGYLALSWSKVSGPGSDTFETPHAEDSYVVVGKTGTYVFELSANDSQYTVTDQVTVVVSATDTAPTVKTDPNNLIYVEASGKQPVDSSLAITDADDTKLNHATATIIANYVSSEDSLSLTLSPGKPLTDKFTVAYNPSTATYTVTAVGGSALIAEFESVLRLIQYKNTSANPSTALRRVEFTVWDESGLFGKGSRYISPKPINRPPVVDAGPEVYQATAGTAITLQGSVSDPDTPDQVTMKWTVVTTPTGGTVTFGPPGPPPPDQTPTPNATFSANGTYVLRLQGSDGLTTAWDQTTVSVCGGLSPNFDLALVVDTSDTMFGSGLEEVKRAAKQFVEVLLSSPGDHRIAVIPFSDDVCARQVLTSDLGLLHTAIDGLAVHGASYMNKGIYSAALELWSLRGRPAAQNPRKVIVIISDGMIDPADFIDDTTEEANQAKNSGIRIITIGTPGNQGIDVAMLTSLASSPSAYLSTANASEISNRLLQIAANPCSLILNGSPLDGSTYVDDLAHLPLAVCDTFVVKEDSVANNLDILANDNLPPNTTVTLADLDIFIDVSTSTQVPLHDRVVRPQGTFELTTIEGRPVIQFTPKPDYFTYPGELSISGTYHLHLHDQPEASVPFTVRVEGVDDAPIANPDYIVFQIQGEPPQDVVVEDQFGTPLLLLNDTNPDNLDEDPIRILQVTQPPPPDAIVLSEDGKTLTYHVGRSVSASPFFYEQTLNYTISDAHGNTSSSTVIFRVTSSSMPEPPEAQVDEFTVPAGIVVDLDVLHNDRSPTGDPSHLSLQPVGAFPAFVYVSPDNDHLFRIDTRAQTAKDVTFSYRAIGPGGLESATVNVIVHITGKSEAYSAQPDPYTFVFTPADDPPVQAPLDPNPLLNDVPVDFPLTALTSVGILSPSGQIVNSLTTAGGTLIKEDCAEGPCFTYNPDATSTGIPAKGSYTYTYQIAYPDGVISTASIIIHVKRTFGFDPNNKAPLALITSPEPLQPRPADGNGNAPPTLTIARVTSGILHVRGVASDPDVVDLVTYTVNLYRYSSQIDDFKQKQVLVTSKSGIGPVPAAGSTETDGLLADLDLSSLPNGVYEVELITTGGGEDAFASTRFFLESELKLGRVQHSEVDYVVNVPGLKLTIQRNYDSLDANALKHGDLGYGWHSALNDLQVEMAEERTKARSLDNEDFSIRIGGSRDITLTLPDGRRRTFIQTFISFPYEEDLQAFKAVWLSPPDAPNVTLEALHERDAILNPVHIGGPWLANSEVDFENYDIGAFKLTLPDGTVYEIQRDDLRSHEFQPEDIDYEGNDQITTPGNFEVHAFGRARVVKVTQSTGDVVEIDNLNILHKGLDLFGNPVATRLLKIDPYDNGRIRAIYVRNNDMSLPTDPVVEYGYDDLGNLVWVTKLIESRTPNPVKVTTTYQYTDRNNPHLLTGIVDARNVPLLVNEYDAAGRIFISRQPDGSFTKFDRTQRTPSNGALFKNANSVGREMITRNSPEQPAPDDKKIIWPLSVEIHEYDANGNLVYSQDAAGLETTRQFGAYNLVTQEQWSVPNQGSGGSAAAYTRSLDYADPKNPLLPTTVIADYANGTPAANQRRTILQYDQPSNKPGVGVLIKLSEPKFSTSGDSYQEFEYESPGVDANNVPLPVSRLKKQTFTGSDPSATAKVLAENRYYTVAGPKNGKLQWTKDAEGNSTVYDYYATQTGGNQPGDLVSVTTYGNNVPDPANPGPEHYLSKTTYTYDSSGNRITETRSRYVRDANGNPTSGEESFTTTFFYDALGRTIKVSDPQPGSTAANKDTVVGQDTVYNLIGQVAKTTDRYNQTTRYFYNRNGEQSCICYPDGKVAFTVTHYDNGQRNVITEYPHNYPLGQGETISGTRAVYDAAGRAIRTERLSGISIIDSTQGAVAIAATSLDTVCDTSYNSDAPATVRSATSTEYYADGRVWKTIDARNRVTIFEYSGDGLHKTIRPPDYTDTSGTFSTQAVEDYDLNGNLIASQTKSFRNGSATPEPFRPVTKHFYDQLNRRKETRAYDDENATGYVTMALSDYDFANRRIRQTDADGTKTKFDYDGQGRLTRVVLAETLPGSTMTSYQYEELGNLITQIDANNHATRFQYDALGRRTRRTLPEPGGALYELWTHDYLESGEQPPAPYKVRNKVYHEDFARRVMITIYDSRGRLDQKKNSLNQVLLDINYTPDGKRSTVKDTFTASINAAAQVTYDYDPSGRLWQKHQPLDASSTATLTYEYYDDGAIKSIQSGPNTVTYAYDGRGRLWKVNPDCTDPQNCDPGAATIGTRADATYEYDPVGNLKSVKYRNDVQTIYTYNTRNQLRRARATNAGGMIANFDYDEAGQAATPNTTTFTWGARRLANSGLRNRMADYVNGTSRTVDYDYDKLQRLTQETIGGASIRYDGLTPAGGSGANMLGYDGVGNRRSRRSTVSPASVVPTPNNVPYDVNDRQDNDSVDTTRSSRFDDNGNTRVPDLNGDGVIDGTEILYSYTYDLDNRLLIANDGLGKGITLSYDGDGNRVKKVVTGPGAGTTYYVVDELNPTGYPQVIEERSCAACGPTVTYVYGLDLVSQNRSGEVRYFGYDGLGSVRYLTHGDSGGVMDTYTYDAFGIQIADWHLGAATLNNYRFTGEQWDSDLSLYYLRARYYSPALGRFWTMDSFEGSHSDPLSLHKYLYCHAAPMNFIDPGGHSETATSINVSTLVNSYLSGAFSNVGANGVIHAVLGQRYSGREILWDFTTGGFLGASGSITKALAGKLGTTWVAKLAFQGGRHAVNALLGTAESCLKDQSGVNGEPAPGFNWKHFAIIYMINYSASVAGDIAGAGTAQIIRDQKTTLVNAVIRNNIRSLTELKAWINRFKKGQRPGIEAASRGERLFYESMISVVDKTNQKMEGQWGNVEKVMDFMLDTTVGTVEEALEEWVSANE